jgi:RNA polymerase sigma-70 factor (ECF subfamily)
VISPQHDFRIEQRKKRLELTGQKGRARFAQTARVDGVVDALWAPGGLPRLVFAFTIRGGRITAIELLADPDRLRQMDVTVRSDET